MPRSCLNETRNGSSIPQSASSRNEHSLARAVRLENKPNFTVLLKSAQRALDAAGVPRFALGDGVQLGGPHFGDSVLPYLPAELWPTSSLQDSPDLLASAGAPEYATRLQVPLVPFTHQETRIALLHHKKHKPKSTMATAFSAAKAHPRRLPDPLCRYSCRNLMLRRTITRKLLTSARPRTASSSKGRAISPRSRPRFGRWLRNQMERPRQPPPPLAAPPSRLL